MISRLAVVLEIGRLGGCSAFSGRGMKAGVERALLHHVNQRLRLEQDVRSGLLFADCLVHDESVRGTRLIRFPDLESVAVAAFSFLFGRIVGLQRDG